MKKKNNNIHRLVVYLYNPVRKGSTTGRGSKDFRTTNTFNNVETIHEALEIINRFTDGYENFSLIKKAYYNGEVIISDGKWIVK